MTRLEDSPYDKSILFHCTDQEHHIFQYYKVVGGYGSYREMFRDLVPEDFLDEFDLSWEGEE